MDYKIILKKIIKFSIFILLFPKVLVIVFYLKITRKKIIYLFTSRIGDFCLTTEFFMRFYKEDIEKKKVIVVSNKKLTSNLFIYNCFINLLRNKNLTVLEGFFSINLFYMYKEIINFFNLEINIYTDQSSGFRPNFNKLFIDSKPSLDFSIYSDDFNLLLENLNFKKNSNKICCIHFRDNAYLNKIYSDIDWGFNDFRNADINNYYLAINKLINEDYFVFIVGYNFIEMNKDKIVDPKKLINFHKSKFFSPKNETLLIANCDIMIGTNSGISHLPQILNNPELMVNFTPFGEQPFGKNNMFIPKKIFDKSRDRYLSLRETINRNLHLDNSFHSLSSKNLIYVENTPAEIHAALIDFLYYTSSVENFTPTLEQIKFNKILVELNVINCNDNFISSSYLEENKYLID